MGDHLADCVVRRMFAFLRTNVLRGAGREGLWVLKAGSKHYLPGLRKQGDQVELTQIGHTRGGGDCLL